MKRDLTRKIKLTSKQSLPLNADFLAKAAGHPLRFGYPLQSKSRLINSFARSDLIPSAMRHVLQVS